MCAILLTFYIETYIIVPYRLEMEEINYLYSCLTIFFLPEGEP
jgi:hypothetical protein